MKILTVCILALLALLLTACAPNQYHPNESHHINAAEIQYNVVLKPTGNQLKIDGKAKGWKKDGKKNGYVGFDKGQSGLVTFGIRKESVGDTCAAVGEEGDATWVITKILLTATGNPSTEKGSNWGGDQSAYPWLKEAFPGVDLTDGSIFTTKNLMEGRSSVSIYSANEQVGETFTYYKVYASKCNGSAVAETDPGIGNGGRK